MPTERPTFLPLYLLGSSAGATLAGVAGLEPTLTESKSVELTNYSIPQYKTRRTYFGPEAGLEPAIAFVEGKCLNHLNYSGSKDCCSRLWCAGWDSNPEPPP